MYKYIEELRSKPDHHKRRIALGISTIVTGLIFVGWLSVLLPQGANNTLAQNQNEPKGETPLTTLKNSVAQVFEAMRGIGDDANSLNLEEEYNRMKEQVESGEIELVPEGEQQNNFE